MRYINRKSQFILFVAYHYLLFANASLETFVVSFQEDGSWSTDQWMRYKEKIKALNQEFTICHWEKLRYFSTDISSIYSYCYNKNPSDSSLKCWQFYYETDYDSAGRKINLIGNVKVKALPYKHRQWNHFCVVYSSSKKLINLYHNGNLMQTELEGNFTEIENGDTVWRSTFIIGQEPDTFEGGYDPAQLFNGELSELNIWSYLISDESIKELSLGTKMLKGDVISWHIDSFQFNQVQVIAQQSISTFVKDKKDLIIFPKKVSHKAAKSLCNVHGGEIVVPTNENEAIEIMDIVKKHESTCLIPENNLQNGKAVWIGMERVNRNWYFSNSSDQKEAISYSNWDSNRCTSDDCGYEDLGCPYLQTNSFWAFGLSLGTCSTLELCTVCSFTETPLFTLKGVCSQDSQLDWNYYFVTNQTTDQIVGFEGYKTSDLRWQDDGYWKLLDDGVSAETFDYPVGRKDWDYIDRSCEMPKTVRKSLTLSTCILGKEFSCDSGQCIGMLKRCDKAMDCDDGSDESNCDLVVIPSSYDKIHSPPEMNVGKDMANSLITRVSIMTVDVIDTLKMLIGITFEIQIKWKDIRLNFENLSPNEKNLIPEKISNVLWLPCENIIHDNAILGEIVQDRHRVVGVLNLTESMPVLTTDSIENYVYNGTATQLFMLQRFKITYSCIFGLAKFPFDEHDCNFIIKLRRQGNSSISFAQDKPSIIYHGPSTVGQFRIASVASHIVNNETSTNLLFSMKISRLYMNQMLNSFLPTALLWSVAYFTHFISTDNFSDRFIGTVTALLVLVALLSSVNGDLPKTSYFKYIDCWFLWYITTILLIILFHIFLNRTKNTKASIFNSMMFRQKNQVDELEPNLRIKINKLSMICFALTTILFDAIYFYLTTL